MIATAVPAGLPTDPPARMPAPPGVRFYRWGERLMPGVSHKRATVLAALVALVALAPLGFIVAATIAVGWDAAAAMIFRPRVGELLLNTALLEGFALPAAVGLGVGLAWLTERTDLPAARVWAWLAVAPLAVPAFVQSYAWTD